MNLTSCNASLRKISILEQIDIKEVTALGAFHATAHQLHHLEPVVDEDFDYSGSSAMPDRKETDFEEYSEHN